MTTKRKKKNSIKPQFSPAILVLENRSIFKGIGLGYQGNATGEICFNTGLTGYQETLTDPSYAEQLITFTFPHIGNVGVNAEDYESKRVFCKGLVIRESITNPSSFRSENHLQSWLEQENVIGISSIDTRALTRYIRLKGPQHGCIVSVTPGDTIAISEIHNSIKDTPNLLGLELTKGVTTDTSYEWNEHSFSLGLDYLDIVDYFPSFNFSIS